MNRRKNAAFSSSFKKIVGIILFVAAVSYIFDDLFNGIIADWFTKNFIWTEASYDESILYSGIYWNKLKYFLICCLTVVSLILVFGVSFLNKMYAQKKKKETIDTLADELEQFLENGGDLSVFSKEFSSISLPISKLQRTAMEKERLLEQEMQQKNDLITYLAHDLKTPLASVIGYLCLLDETSDLPQPIREQYTQITLEKAYRLEQLINEFFEITRYNLHTIVINPGKIHIRQMLLQMADEFYPILEEQHKGITVEAPADFTFVGDADKLARVFNNILKNAASYSDPGSTIQIHVQPCESEVILSFTNEGTPIPKHLCQTIFEKFYRLDSSRSSKTGGSGLGLAIAKQIVEAHHGTIAVKSDVEHTTFTVTLPLSQP